MRRTLVSSVICLLLAGAAAGCSSDDEVAADCAAALAERIGGDAADKPTISEAQERVDALDDTLADMVRSGHAGVAEEAFDAMGTKAEKAGKGRPEACKSLSEDDYTVMRIAKAIDGLGWTDEDGKFDKLKMVENLD
jgi:hypothetical protein